MPKYSGDRCTPGRWDRRPGLKDLLSAQSITFPGMEGNVLRKNALPFLLYGLLAAAMTLLLLMI